MQKFKRKFNVIEIFIFYFLFLNQQNGKINLWKCYFAVVKDSICQSALYKFFGYLLSFSGPLCIDGIVSYFESLQSSSTAMCSTDFNSSSICSTVSYLIDRNRKQIFDVFFSQFAFLSLSLSFTKINFFCGISLIA